MASNSIILLTIFMLLASLCLTEGSGPNGVSQARDTAKKAKAAVQATANIAKKYATGRTKEIAETCIETCGDAIDQVNQCLDALKAFNRGRISDLQSWGSAALTNVGTCDDEFGSGEPADLKQASQNAQNLLDWFLGIVNGL